MEAYVLGGLRDGFEADDVIATLAARSSMPVEVITGDREALELRQVEQDDPVLGIVTNADQRRPQRDLCGGC